MTADTVQSARVVKVFNAKSNCAASKQAVADSRAALVRSNDLIQKSKQLLGIIHKPLPRR